VAWPPQNPPAISTSRFPSLAGNANAHSRQPSESEHAGLEVGVEDTISLIESGRIELPTGVDMTTFGRQPDKRRGIQTRVDPFSLHQNLDQARSPEAKERPAFLLTAMAKLFIEPWA
jgi:hypothetical protein